MQNDLISRQTLLEDIGAFQMDIVAKATVMKVIERQQHKDGWILCSSGMLPEEHDSMFAKLKGTDRWKTGMFEKISDEVYVTIEDEKGSRITAHAHTIDGRWSSNLLRAHKTYRVIAWKPLPESYRGSE